MEKETIYNIVTKVLGEYMESQDKTVEINEHTPMLGSDSVVDSLGLVNVIVDIESVLLDNDVEISLTSDKAMSSRISPFRNVASLVNFIYSQVNGKNE
ncbi:MAG: hypothetical protein ACM3S2_10015 [Ignavibacteriales bacterium]